MVGDPQQSIYRRADVRVYEDLRARLVRSGAAEELTFSVTLRCDEAIVARVNDKFPDLLHGREGQAKFVPLQARPGAGAGSVGRLPVARPENFPAKPKLEDLLRAEAAALARWLKNAGPAGAGAEGWEEVAVLAPRKKWLGALAVALRSSMGFRLISILPLLRVVLVPSTPIKVDRLSTAGSLRITAANCCWRLDIDGKEMD